MRDQYIKSIEQQILDFKEKDSDIKKTKKVLDLIKELESRKTISQDIETKKKLLNTQLTKSLVTFDSPNLIFFFTSHNNSDIIERIHNTNSCTTKLLSLIYNGELIEDEDISGSEKVFEKLNKLGAASALFSLNVKFYNFHLKDLSLNPKTILEFIHREKDRSETMEDVIGFSLPYKEEAIKILLYIGSIIISKNQSVQIVGGVNIDNAANKVSLLFSKPDTTSVPPPYTAVSTTAAE